MSLRTLLLSSLVLTSIASSPAPIWAAADAQDAREFHELLRSVLPPELRNDQHLALAHLIPDAAVISATQADSVEHALERIKSSSLAELTAANQKTSLQPKLDSGDILKRHQITIVLIPGIFGEFIPTRAFEEVLAQPSAERDAFKLKVNAAIENGDSDGRDGSFDLRNLKDSPRPLDELVNVGSLKGEDGQTVARVVLLYTPFMSLESMGNLKQNAEIFNRRLSKYVDLTGAQDLAFVGYSRGAALGLEMLAQAKEQNANWLPDVKAMISLGGVNWGSTLADDTENPNAVTFKAVQEVKKLRAGLDPGSWTATLSAWGTFAANMAFLGPELLKHVKSPSTADLKASPISSGVDGSSVLGLVQMFREHLGLDNPLNDFANNVRRFETLLDAVLDGVGTLTTHARKAWWSTHALPNEVKYYAITAAMANPEASDADRTAFNGKVGYNNSYDDLSLLQNRLDYETISGVSLNDSQVSVAQAMFLPAAEAQLNPANAGLNSAFLGTVGTHHWGLALQVVNAMKDGRTNPFPREALLKALAAKVALDLEGHP